MDLNIGHVISWEVPQRQYLIVISKVTINIWTYNQPSAKSIDSTNVLAFKSFQTYSAVPMRYHETKEKHAYFDEKNML